MNLVQSSSKSQLLNLSDASLRWRELFYSIIEDVLDRTLKTSKVSALRYDPYASTYAIIQSKVLEGLDLNTLVQDIEYAILNIQKVDLLYALTDKDSIFLDKKPVSMDHTFFYNPYREICNLTPQLKTQLVLLLKNLSFSKKSSLLKVILPTDLSLIGLV